MNEAEVHALVASHADERARAHHRELFPDSPLTALGVPLTKLRKVAREVGRDRALAQTLWHSDVYELRLLALLIDDPKAITVEQAEAQVEHVTDGQLAHVFASCDATLAKSPVAVEVAERWTHADDALRRRCGHTLVYELSKSRKKSAPDDAWFAERIAHIDATWSTEDIDGRMAMATALMGMGKRSAALWPEALRVAEDIGPVDFDPTGGCAPLDVVKHIDHPRVREKLGVG
jgi:3-methyladenine DNA glycosylase AlkD